MNPAVPSARSRPPKPWRTCGRSCARGRRAPDCRVARPSGSGTTGGDARGARVPARPRARAARRCARDGEDAAGTHPGARPRRQIPAHPVHTRFDARRHHRSHTAQRRAGVHLPAGADLRRSRARGRDQPRTGEDAGGAARGDAGAHGHGGRHRAPAVRDLHRVRHAEPRGVRGHLPAAGGRAGSLHDEGARRLSRRERGAGDPGAHGGGIRGGSAGDLRRDARDGRSRFGAIARCRRVRAGRATNRRLHHGGGARDAGGGVAHLGRQPTGGRVAPEGRSRGGAPRRARLRDPRRREGTRVRRAAPPGECRARARAGRRHAGRGAQGDPRQDRSTHDVILCTPRALWLGAGLALFGLAGLWLPWGLEAMLLGDLALAAAVWLDGFLAPQAGPRPRHLVALREAPPAFSVGRPGEVTYRWRNGAPRAARLRLREVRPDLLGGAQPPRWIRVAARGETREVVAVNPARRGRQRGGGFVLDSVGPLGLGLRRERIALPWEVAVYPPLVTVRLQASLARAQRRWEQGITPLRRLGEGRLFESLRDWVPGDDLRHIDWKATGRRGKVITRQFEAERRQHVLLVLDLGRLLTAEIAGVARLEYVVRAALELAYTAVQHDDNVGVMAFADGVQQFVAPQRGRLALKRVLDVLARVEPRLVEPDYPGAFRYLAARNRKRALTVLFTDVIDRFASDALVANVASLRPRHLPLAVTLQNPEVDAVAALRPNTPRDAFRKAAAEELLRPREEALGRMRRAGVLVLDVPPERAASAVVAKYLELKRRGRL